MTAIYSVAFRTLEFALTKNYTVANWISNVGSDVVIAAVAATFAYFGGKMLLGLGIVVLPIGAGIFVSVIIGMGLTMLEGRYQIKEKILKSINSYLMSSVVTDANKLMSKVNADKALHQLNNSSFGAYY